MTGSRKGPVPTLVVDDDESVRRILQRHLEDAGYDVSAVEGGSAALALLRHGPAFGAMVTDIQMPGMSGLELLAEAKRLHPTLACVVITAHGTVETAVEAMRSGAFDYVEKPFHKDVLLLTLERALSHSALVRDNLRLTEALTERFSLGRMIGGSPGMQALFREASRIATSSVTALLLGESGTGKELLAKALHAGSRCAAGPFVTVNVAALPSTLVEAELFGVEKGAFTGATSNREGLFRAADGGTLFLDEVGEMPLELQPKFLRVLEGGEIRPVGGTREFQVDVRVLAATNRDLAAAVEEGAFRRDLYHRLAVGVLRLPPLRDRIEDLPLLVSHLLAKHGAASLEVDEKAMRALAEYRWPGNVRELENELRRAVLRAGENARVTVDDLSPEILHGRADPDSPAVLDPLHVVLPEDGVDLAVLERELIKKALDRTEGNQTAAARLLGITRQTLIYRMEKHDLRD